MSERDIVAFDGADPEEARLLQRLNDTFDLLNRAHAMGMGLVVSPEEARRLAKNLLDDVRIDMKRRPKP